MSAAAARLEREGNGGPDGRGPRKDVRAALAKFHFGLFQAHHMRGSLRRKEQQQQQQQQQEEEDGGGGSGLSNRLPAGGGDVEATAWRHLTAANAIEFQRHVGEQQFFDRKRLALAQNQQQLSI